MQTNKDNLKKMCRMINIPIEFFDYYTRRYSSKTYEYYRKELLSLAGIE